MGGSAAGGDAGGDGDGSRSRALLSEQQVPRKRERENRREERERTGESERTIECRSPRCPRWEPLPALPAGDRDGRRKSAALAESGRSPLSGAGRVGGSHRPHPVSPRWQTFGWGCLPRNEGGGGGGGAAAAAAVEMMRPSIGIVCPGFEQSGSPFWGTGWAVHPPPPRPRPLYQRCSHLSAGPPPVRPRAVAFYTRRRLRIGPDDFQIETRASFGSFFILS